MLNRLKLRTENSERNMTKRRRFRSEEGSALVLVMFIVLLLTILGMGVLSATVGGAVRTETRENDVQSLHLAQKGLDEAAAYIQARLAKLQDINPDELEDILKALDKEGLNVSTELGMGNSGTIDFIEYKDKYSNDDEQTRQYYIDVESSALVNGVQRTLQQRITIDSYPDFLKYAFGSEQNVIINGAPLIEGNIYAGKQLIVSDTAKYTYLGYDLTQPTVYPVIDPNSEEDESNSGEIFVQSLKDIGYFENRQDKGTLAESADMESTAQKILGVSIDKVKIKDQHKFVSINVEESFGDKLGEASSGKNVEEIRTVLKNKTGTELAADIARWANSKITFLPITQPPVKPVKVDGEAEDVFQERLANYDTAFLTYNNTFIGLNSSNFVNGDLSIDGVNYKEIAFTDAAKGGTNPSWLVVNGDLNITNDNANFISVKGNILVTGDVTIRGKVKFDSTMLVLGVTTVEDATIDGIEKDGGRKKELVLISKGKIFLNRINAFNNTASEMNAFFYTDSTAELYGVGSIFWLTGGFFSKGDLTINAVMGQTKAPVNATPGDKLTFTNQARVPNEERFKVTYNHHVYTDQQSSLPRVSNVNISVGPLRLVDSSS